MQIQRFIRIISPRVPVRLHVCVFVSAAACPGNCFVRFIAGAAVGEHFGSYFQWRKTSWEKATGGSTRCCTFKGQIAHIYATAACHRPEERLFTATAAVSYCLSRTKQERHKTLGDSKRDFFFFLPTQLWFCLLCFFSSTILKVTLVVAFKNTEGTKQWWAASSDEPLRRRQRPLIVGLVSDNLKVLPTLTDWRVIVNFFLFFFPKKTKQKESRSCAQLSVQPRLTVWQHFCWFLRQEQSEKECRRSWLDC